VTPRCALKGNKAALKLLGAGRPSQAGVMTEGRGQKKLVAAQSASVCDLPARRSAGWIGRAHCAAVERSEAGRDCRSG
jgi:hypothetical protein